jgi:hypothetical protein
MRSRIPAGRRALKRIGLLPATRAFALALALAALLGAASGCLDHYDVGELAPPPERSTLGELLALFVRASEDPARSVAATDSCLDEDFRFYFTETDRATYPEIPAFVGKDLILAATDSLFRHAEDIDMSITVYDTVSVGPCDASGAETCWELLVAIVLTVQAPPPPGETEGTLYFAYGQANITITRDPDNARQYVIREIVDRTLAADQPGPPPGALAARAARAAAAAPAWERISWGRAIFLFFF